MCEVKSESYGYDCLINFEGIFVYFKEFLL